VIKRIENNQDMISEESNDEGQKSEEESPDYVI